MVWSGWCDSLAGGQPEHAYTDGVGGMAAAGSNHTGRGSMPTQEAKFPVSLRAFHVSWLIVRNSAAEVEESSRCFREFTIDEIKSGKRFHQVLSRCRHRLIWEGRPLFMGILTGENGNSYRRMFNWGLCPRNP